MAAGKTTLGHEVARQTGCTFTDLDQAIEHETGMTVSEIFATGGQGKFRAMESETLRRITGEGHTLIACGGGTPCQADNMRFMLTNGTVVWLQAPVDILVRRLLIYGADRPLVAGKTATQLTEYVDNLVSERRQAYSAAHHTFDASRLETPDQIRESASLFIDKYFK